MDDFLWDDNKGIANFGILSMFRWKILCEMSINGAPHEDA